MISRRLLLGGTVTGAVLGLAGVSLTRDQSSIRFIGRRSTIIALLDTGLERTLMVLGEGDDDLLANITGLTTVGSTRIDLVVASHRVLATQAARDHLEIESIPTISLQAHNSLPPIRGSIMPTSQTREIKIGNSTTMRIALSGSMLSSGDAGDPDFLISIMHRKTRIVLANRDTALRIGLPISPDVLVVPGSPGPIASDRFQPHLFVCNSPNQEIVTSAQLQVYPTDPTVIRLRDGEMVVWDDQVSS